LKSPDNVAKAILSATIPVSTLDVQQVSVAPSAVGYRLDDTGFNSQQGQEIFSLPEVYTNSSVQPASYSMGTRGSFQRSNAARE
jgi:hypothetical protein